MNAKTRKLYTLAKKVERLFPGYKLAGIDPGIALVRWERRNDGKSTAVDRGYLTETAATCLTTGKVLARVTRRDL